MKADGLAVSAPATLLVAVILAALTVLLHGSALAGHWRFDDPAILAHLTDHPSLSAYFLTPAQWQSLGNPSFTPGQYLDYWLDLQVFRLTPWAFYLHHLTMLWLAALLSFLLLRWQTGVLWSTLGAALFLIGAPVAVVAQQIMTRHYVTGLVLAILSVLFWLQARHGKWPRTMTVLCSACYLLALLNKEIFAPLPLVLLFLGTGSFTARCRALWPLALMAGGFVLWRSFMLGKLVGGYSGLDAAWALHHSLANLSQIFLGSGAVAGLALLSILLVAGRAIRGAPRHIPLLLAIAVAVLLPFIAIRVVMHVVDLRFAFLPWWAFSILFVLGLARWVDSRLSHPTGPSCPSPPSRWGQAVTRPTAALLAACVVLAVGLHRQAVFADIEKVSAAYDTQGKFLWSGDGNTGYVPYGDHSGFGLFGYGMSALRLQYQGSKAPQALSFPEVARQSGMPDVVYGYDAACRCMLPRSVPLPTPMARPDPEKPQSLTLLMDRRQGGLIWHVAAPAITECHMVVPARNVSSLIPCRGQLKFELPAWLSGEFRMYVRDGMGRWQRSDPLIFPQHGQWLVWPVAAP